MEIHKFRIRISFWILSKRSQFGVRIEIRSRQDLIANKKASRVWMPSAK